MPQSGSNQSPKPYLVVAPLRATATLFSRQVRLLESEISLLRNALKPFETALNAILEIPLTLGKHC